MVHTSPDYSSKAKIERSYGQVDNGELAARLGSINTIDRRGTIIWYDDFEYLGASKWTITADTIGTATFTVARVWMGNSAMKVVTAAVANDTVTMTKPFSLPHEGTIGVELMTNISGASGYIELYLQCYTGALYHFPAIRYNQFLNTLEYFNDALAWVDVPLNQSFDPGNLQWLYMKLVVDWTTGYYVRCLLGSEEFDLSAIPMYQAANATLPRMDAGMLVKTLAAGVVTCYIDNVIVTQNE